MKAFANGDIYTGDGVLYDSALLVGDGGRIDGVVSQNAIPTGVEVVDLEGRCIAPGFIDLQVNGGGGVLFNDSPSVASICRILEAHRRFGTTDILPTYITGPAEGIRDAARAVGECIRRNVSGVLGLHLEGPFINPKRAGVHDKRYIRGPLTDDSRLLSAEISGCRMVTVAPEIAGERLIRQLVSAGVHVAAGHSDATLAEASEGFSWGVSCVTHIFNAMSQMQAREPGLVGAGLANESAYCSVIADGYHVDFTTLKVAIKAKGRGRTFLVTDAMPPVGADADQFRLGGLTITVQQGRCLTPDGTLAGSALNMATAVRNCVQRMAIPKDEALRMASTYPATYLGLGSELGRIAPGYRANLVIFDNEIHVVGTVVNGEMKLND